MDRSMLFELIYALAATGGREKVLFGDSMPHAREAFSRSLAGMSFPELWFEIPLAGKPWFDLHTLVSRGDFAPNATFPPEVCGGHSEAFRWFAAQDGIVRQLALSWDSGRGDVDHQAVQLLLGKESSVIRQKL